MCHRLGEAHRSPNLGLTLLLHCSLILRISLVPPILFPNKRLLSPLCRWQEMKPRLSSHTQMLVTQPVLQAQGEPLTWELTPTRVVLCIVSSISGAPNLAKKPPHSSCEHRITIRMECFQLISHFLTPHLVQAKPLFCSPQRLDSNLLPHLLQVRSVK